jgi:hypothetical protein
MMRFVILALTLMAVLSPSQAKMTSVERTFIFHKRSVLMSQTVTRNALVHALPKAQRRLVALNELTDDDNDDAPGPEELDLQVSYRRPEVVDVPDRRPHEDDVELSDYVRIRLAVARARAVQAHRARSSTT